MRQLCRLLSDSVGRTIERIILSNRLESTKVITSNYIVASLANED